MPLTGTSACPLETEMRAAAVCLVHGPGPDVSKVRTYVHTVGLHAGSVRTLIHWTTSCR